MHVVKLKTSSFLFAVAAWSLLILRFGYRYGTGDQVELLPYTLFLNNPSLYPHDFFIQGLHDSVPNERTVMANLLRLFVGNLEMSAFLLQAFSTILLVLGLEKLTKRFVSNRYLAWAAVLITLIPLNDFTLGNVELYSECFQASGLSVAVVIWAINSFLARNYIWSSVLLSIATFIQLLDGLDVTIVLVAILFWSVIEKKASLKQLLTFVLIYGSTAGVYLIVILLQKTNSSLIDNTRLFEILFQFRHPHHFIFSTFLLKKTITFFILSAIAFIYYRRQSKELFLFTLISAIILVFYIVMVDVFQVVFVGNFQFYKLTQWIKFLGVVAVFAKLSNWRLPVIDRFEKSFLTLTICATWSIIFCCRNLLPYQVPFELFNNKKSNEIIVISQLIERYTAVNSVFIQPFENTELKFYAQRSSYVEFKANVRNKKFVNEWYSRIQQVYGVNGKNGVSGFKLQENGDNYFYHLSYAQLSALKSKGVTHVLTLKQFPPAIGHVIITSKNYAVYQL